MTLRKKSFLSYYTSVTIKHLFLQIFFILLKTTDIFYNFNLTRLSLYTENHRINTDIYKNMRVPLKVMHFKQAH